MFDVALRDPNSKTAGRVSGNGEVVVGSLSYSSPYAVSLTVDNVPVNIVQAKTDSRFVMIGILIATAKSVVGEKTIQVYEGEFDDSLAVDSTRDILTLDMVRSDRAYLPLVNVATDRGRFVNAVCDDSVVNITIFGYYVASNGDGR